MNLYNLMVVVEFNNLGIMALIDWIITRRGGGGVTNSDILFIVVIFFKVNLTWMIVYYINFVRDRQLIKIFVSILLINWLIYFWNYQKTLSVNWPKLNQCESNANPTFCLVILSPIRAKVTILSGSNLPFSMHGMCLLEHFHQSL